MREIVNLQIGNCGNAIGTQFWEMVCCDHGLNNSGCFEGTPDNRLENINVFFTEVKGKRYAPRSVMIDLDKSSLETSRSSPIGEIFKPENCVFGITGTGNNWAKGHFSEGASLCNKGLEVIRKEVEGCDSFCAFQVVHSIGGGTGAGLGCLLLNHLRDEYPRCTTSSYSVIPSPKIAASVVEPYNAILTMSHLSQFTDETFCIDNEALFSIASNSLKTPNANFCDVNHLVSLVMSGVTTCVRFPGESNSSLRKVAVNMIPYPRLHFFVPSFAPIIGKNATIYRKLSIQEITSQIFEFKNMYAACNVRNGKFMTVACLYRGDVPTKEINLNIKAVQDKESSTFVEWIPDNIKTGLCSQPFPGVSRTATFIGNTTAIKDIFTRIQEQYRIMFQRKAFVHFYTDEGLEEIEFTESDANLNDLVNEFLEYESWKADEPPPKPQRQGKFLGGQYQSRPPQFSTKAHQ